MRNPNGRLSRHATIERDASRLLREHGISDPPVPVRELAARIGIDVRFQPFSGDSDVSAVLKRGHETAVIGVNSAHPPNRQRFSIAHELGHYYLHAEEPVFIDFGSRIQKPQSRYRNAVSSEASNKEEIDANTFAAALLMPRNMVRREIATVLENDPELDPESVVIELAHRFGVSRDAMNFRLLNLGLLITLG